MARVSGRRSVTLVPAPGLLETSMVPRRLSTRCRTTSMPTPRPETSVTCLAVEKPGSKMQSEDLGLGQLSVARRHQALLDGAARDRLGIDAAAVVGDADQHAGPGVPGGEMNRRRGALALRARAPPAARCRDPCCCGSGASAGRPTGRSRSCPAPCRRLPWSARHPCPDRAPDRAPGGGTSRMWREWAVMRMFIEFSRRAEVSRSISSETAATRDRRVARPARSAAPAP